MKLAITTIIAATLLTGNAYAADNMSTTQDASNQTQAVAEKNKREGERFLLANKNKPGVKSMPNGLQYKVIERGKGIKPTIDNIVTVDYEGHLINGKQFDSSYERGQPATFPVTGVIAGWTEALQMMKVGATWELYIPPTLAYGERGVPPVIGPNETLIFKVKLLGIK